MQATYLKNHCTFHYFIPETDLNNNIKTHITQQHFSVVEKKPIITLHVSGFVSPSSAVFNNRNQAVKHFALSKHQVFELMNVQSLRTYCLDCHRSTMHFVESLISTPTNEHT